jgi:hypothetical protein
MSTSSATRQSVSATRAPRVSPKQQAVKATEQLRDVLRLPGIEGDTNAFTTALAEVAANESRHNPRFAEAVRVRYQELTAQLKAPGGRGKSPPLADLVPIRRIEGYRADPFSPPDPQFLTQLYGLSQLPSALQYYRLETLKETATKIEREHPGTRPTSRSSKAAVIDYIVKYSPNGR